MLKNARKTQACGSQSSRLTTTWTKRSLTAFAAHRPSLHPSGDIHFGSPMAPLMTRLDPARSNASLRVLPGHSPGLCRRDLLDRAGYFPAHSRPDC